MADTQDPPNQEPDDGEPDAVDESADRPAPTAPPHPGPYPALLHHQFLTPRAPLAPGAAMRVYPMVSPPMASSVPATWAADPSGLHELRWWNGAAWTDQVVDGGEATIDPLP